MIIRKSSLEIGIMRAAGDIVSRIHDTVRACVRPGITTGTLDKIIEEQIAASGAKAVFKGYSIPKTGARFPYASYLDVNEEIVHSLPKARPLLEGDIVDACFGIVFQGYHSFQTITYPVGRLTAGDAALLTTTHTALQNAVQAAQPGGRLFDISQAIQSTVEGAGFSVSRDYIGCGVGTSHHEEPRIPNFVDNSSENPRLKPGMVLSIHPVVHAGRPEGRLLPDGFTAVAADGKKVACFSQIVAITENGAEILTPYRADWLQESGHESSLLLVYRDQVVKVLPARSLNAIESVALGGGERLIISTAQTLCRETQLILGRELDEFERLLNQSTVREEELQNFFEQHPKFLLGSDYRTLRSKVILEQETGGRLIPDFFLEPIFGEYWDILDLTLTNRPIVVGTENRRRFSQQVSEACAQLRTYGAFFDDPRSRERIFKQYGIRAYRPRLSVVIGRSLFDEGPVRCLLESDLAGVKVITYDELLAKARQRTLYTS